MPSTIIALFNLKAGASEAEYRRFVEEQDIPGVKALRSVSDFRVQKAMSLLSGENSPYQFVEIIEVEDMEAFRQEARPPATSAAVARFRAEFADNPIFIVTESFP